MTLAVVTQTRFDEGFRLATVHTLERPRLPAVDETLEELYSIRLGHRAVLPRHNVVHHIFLEPFGAECPRFFEIVFHSIE